MTVEEYVPESIQLPTCRIGDATWCDLIRDGASAMGIAVTDDQVRGFATHAGALIDWNRRTNLTRITDPATMAISHFVDSLAALPYLPDSGHLLDVGSGGGFPGIPLQIMQPALCAVLVDAVRKKVSFLKHVLRVLTLSGAEARHCRLSDLAAQTSGLAPVDVVVSRAVGQLDGLLAEAAPLLSPRGCIIAYLGSIDDIPGYGKEITELPGSESAVRLTGPSVVQYRLPLTGARRALSIWRNLQ